MDIKLLNDVAESLLTKKAPINSLWQEVADNFYPERADFTITRSIGTDFAAQLMSSFPIQCRRSLGDQFSTMLRPTARPWFHTRRRHEKKDSGDVQVYLEWFEQVQRKAMYDPGAMFTRATKEGDHDFAAFGQCAISVEINKLANGLLFRSHHLRDMAWQENEEGKVSFIVRKWKPTALTLKRTFKKIPREVEDTVGKSPFEEIDCRHFVVDADLYDDDAKGRPRWSIWYDFAHQQILDATPIWGRHYVIPRWQTVSGSQYSYSPATVCALPDARLLQAMTFTLLEAGEKATQPPIIATKDAVKSDLAIYAGGVTWVDQDYDERLGAAIRPLEQDFRGFNYGVEMNRDTRSLLEAAFFLNKLKPFNPATDPQMTAFQAGQIVQDYIRNALPIFEPMEMEYNAALCDETFELLWRHGAFGSPDSWPRELRGAEIDFTFESPLHDAIEQQKGQKFQEASQLIAQAIAMDPSAAFLPKTETMLRDALQGIGAPATWVNGETEVQQAREQQQAQQAAQQKLAAMEQASNAAKNIGQSGMIPQAQPVAA